MAKRTGAAHVVTTTRKYKNRVYRTHLLRRSYREDGKVKNETLGNLSHLPDSLIEIRESGKRSHAVLTAGKQFRFFRGLSIMGRRHARGRARNIFFNPGLLLLFVR